MARIVQSFDKIQRDVMAYLYRDGSATIEVNYYSNSDAENVTLFTKVEISPEGVRALLDVLGDVRLLTPDAADLRHTCGDCGKELQIVRPGKYQCVNPKCGASR